MFYSITGDLVLTEPDAAVIDCGGVAYRLTVSANTLSAVTPQKRYNGKGSSAHVFVGAGRCAGTVRLF